MTRQAEYAFWKDIKLGEQAADNIHTTSLLLLFFLLWKAYFHPDELKASHPEP